MSLSVLARMMRWYYCNPLLPFANGSKN